MEEQYNKDSLISFYEENIKVNKGGFGSVAWGSRKSQEKRFDILSKIAPLNGSSLLDVGCGLGDFYGWVCRNGLQISYKGIDITPSMIQQARENYKEAKFEELDILTDTKAGSSFDYVFSSGIFNRKISNHEAFVKSMISQMYAICRKGVAFNILSTKADFMEESEFYADPCEMLNFCLTLSRAVVLKHNYMPHDFTVYLYKSCGSLHE
jgi:ubiquinone/menaquinone biosynthesis C-methylase UbiE